MQSQLSWRVLGPVALVVFGSGAFLFVYQQTFGFHPIMVVFGAAEVLFGSCLVGLIFLGVAKVWPAGWTRLLAWVFGIGATIFLGTLIAIFCGAYVSNALWGDTNTYSTALLLAGFSKSSFIPLLPEQMKSLFIGGFAVLVLVLAAAVTVMAWISSRLFARLQWWFALPVPRELRPTRQLKLLVVSAVLSGAVCAALVISVPHTVRDEPISSFFELIPVSSALYLDDARVAAAIEDKRSRATYPKPAKFDRKNVIVIFADSLRADHMGLYGYHRATTPFLSALYAEKRLHRVDTALSTCSESFCGIASTFASRPFHQISSLNFTLHSLLHDLGYLTRFFLAGSHRSWTYLSDFYGDDIDEIQDVLFDDRPLIDALDTIAPAGEQPNFFYFFLMSSHMLGHKQSEFDRFQPAHVEGYDQLEMYWNEIVGTRRVWAGSKSQVVRDPLDDREILRALENRYDNGVLQTDAYLERIFSKLDAKGYLRGSIVVILGDHGDGLGERGHLGHTRYLFQEDIHIPLLIYDDDISRYRTSDFATQIDVAPTIVDRLGLAIPPGWQGRSLLEPPTSRMTLHQTRRGSAPCFAVVDRSAAELMKYMKCGIAGDHTLEALFDLRADPGEKNNLLQIRPKELVDRYRTVIDSRSNAFVNRCLLFECID